VVGSEVVGSEVVVTGLQFFVHSDPDAVRVELAGSVRGANVETVRHAWESTAFTDTLKPVIVDITFITDVDEQGRALLSVMHRSGARIIAQSPESSVIAQPIMAEPVEDDGSKPGWFRRLIAFLTEKPPAGAALPAEAEIINLASAADRRGCTEYMRLDERGRAGRRRAVDEGGGCRMLRSVFNFLDPEDTLGSLWCSLVHEAPMWPIHGQYGCRTCGRLHRVPWVDAKPGQRVAASVAGFGARSLAGQGD
jgi:hypothetical protein